MTHEMKIIWHDLIEDPNDLPTDDKPYMVSIHSTLFTDTGEFPDRDYIVDAYLDRRDDGTPFWFEYDPEYEGMEYPMTTEDGLSLMPVAWAEQPEPYLHHE